MRSHVNWLAPMPLWAAFSARTLHPLVRRPALLRFATDTFMDDLVALLNDKPDRLHEYVARKETWRTPAAGLDPVVTPTRAELKLWQPVHARFYLVAASLTCRVPGLPDHTVQVAAGEKVTFVLRRVRAFDDTSVSVLDANRRTEYGWVPAEHGGEWLQSDARGRVAGEEQLPMFPVVSSKVERRLFAGFIPVAKHQTFVAAQERDLPAPSSTGQPPQPETADQKAARERELAIEAQLLDLHRRVIEPWLELIEASKDFAPPEVTGDITGNTRWRDFFDQSGIQTDEARFTIRKQFASALILIDFGEFLREHLPSVWDLIKSPPSGSLSGAALTLYNALNVTPHASDAGKTLVQAIWDAWSQREQIESLTGDLANPFVTGYTGVRLEKLYTNATTNALEPGAWEALLQRDPAAGYYEDADTQDANLASRKLKNLVRAALAQAAAAQAALAASNVAEPVLPKGATAALKMRKPSRQPANPLGNDWYVIRCIYERPNCGRHAPAVISDATEPFQLSSFFDADAPSRSLQIALPIDTRPGTLKKYERNVAFPLSDELQRQLSRVKSMKDLITSNIADPKAVDFGIICSLSIPIVTICALILLIIMVRILDLIFHWIPFLFMCFPMPKLKAKLAAPGGP